MHITKKNPLEKRRKSHNGNLLKTMFGNWMMYQWLLGGHIMKSFKIYMTVLQVILTHSCHVKCLMI